ncbi:SubName: Full=Related to SUR2-sphingosine hydroxylase {ECO:0000313/EMBL:CCA71884.1} [Serendipita indica DSM 11827]|nr:SubName: Full=Related to SUR2-sphingosine hydroxylase {ECO:0000313/EMBL:CCA71884.1} [Serendipita indica DSM 11827]
MEAEPAIYLAQFADSIVPRNGTYPFYYSERESILEGVSDKTLSLAAPLVAYWVYSLIFHFLDVYGTDWAWLAPYRIHESAEVTSRNLVGKWHVVQAVFVQQLIQTVLGVLLVEEKSSVAVDHTAKMARMSPILVQSTLLWLGNPYVAQARLESWGASILYFVYWWFIPVVQILFAL